MKTFHHTSSQNSNRTRNDVRLGMTLVGIVTAIIGSVALLYETPFMQREVNLPYIETTKIVATDLSVEVSAGAVVSAIWP